MSEKQRRLIWAAIFGAGAAYEVVGLIDQKSKHATLSETTRSVFHTDSRIGKTAWFFAWGALSSWLAWHIPHTKED